MKGMSTAVVYEHNRRQLHEKERRWFAVHTPFRKEKSAARELQKKGIDCYVPLVEKTKRYERKIKTYQVPLINNYLFVHIVKKEYVSVLQARDVFDFVRFDRDLIAVPDEEMELLKRIVGESASTAEWSQRPIVGQKVEIIGGKLTGIQGMVIKEKGRKQLVIELETLGWAIQLEVDEKYIRPVI